MRTNKKQIINKRLLIEYDNKVTRISIVDYIVPPNPYTLITECMSEYKAISLQKVIEHRLGTKNNSIKGNNVLTIREIINSNVKWYNPVKQQKQAITLDLKEKTHITLLDRLKHVYNYIFPFTIIRKTKLDSLHSKIGELTTLLLIEQLNNK